jgi:hypothetical protein
MGSAHGPETGKHPESCIGDPGGRTGTDGKSECRLQCGEPQLGADRKISWQSGRTAGTEYCGGRADCRICDPYCNRHSDFPSVSVLPPGSPMQDSGCFPVSGPWALPITSASYILCPMWEIIPEKSGLTPPSESVHPHEGYG